MNLQKIDTVIYPRWVIPIEPENVVYENYAIAIDQGKILNVLPKEQAIENYDPKEKIYLKNHVLLPGFINTHTHTPMSLFKGFADDLALMNWLNNYIWPAEKKWLGDEFCYDGAMLAILEMLRGGTTCFNDNYFFMESIGRAAEDSYIRAALGITVLDFPTAYSNNAEETLAKAEDIYANYKNHDLISVSIAPQGPYTCCDETFLKVKDFAEKNNVPIHLHLHETLDEIAMSHLRPINRLHNLGILSKNTQAIHFVHATLEDIILLKETGVHVVHSPESNLKLASGFCPVKQFMDVGINVALGTDGSASNNDLDMLGEMKTAAILAKAVSGDPTALNAFEALKMATLNGAKAMGLENQTGSLIPNKSADIIAIDLSFPCTQPVFNPISQIVYAANSQQVTDVWVAGKQLLKNSEFVYLDAKAVLDKAKIWRSKIKP